MATSQGVSRFNGYEFQNFTKENGLVENSALEIYEDYKGRIWFIPLSGKLSYFFHDSIYTYKYNDRIQKVIKALYQPVKMGFFVDKEENVYLSMVAHGIIKVSSLGITTIVDTKDEYYKKYAMLFFVDKDKILSSLAVYGNISGLYLRKDKQLINIPYNFTKKPTGRMSAITYKNKTIIYHINDLLIIENGKIIDKFSYSNEIIWLSKDDNGNIWVSLRKKGICLFSKADHFNNPDAIFLKNLSVSSLITDSEGGIWFSTLEKGIFYIPSKDIHAYTCSDGLKATKINTVDIDEKKVWFAGNHSEIYNIEEEKLTVIDYFKSPEIYYEFIRCHRGKVYMSGITSGTYLIDNGILKKFCDIYLKNIYFGKGDEIYMLNNGIIKIVKGKRSRFIDDLHFIDKTYCMCPDNKGNFWIGSNNGLKLLKNNFIEDWSKKNPLFNYSIHDLKNDSVHGNLWIGTKGGGLLLKTQDTLIQFTVKNGMPGNSINKLYLEGGDLWIGTNQGLAKLERSFTNKKVSYKIKTYQVYDGLISNEINDLVLKDSMVYLATSGGLCFFDKTRIKQNSTPPPIYVQGIKINDKDTSLLNEYYLPHDKNNITIDYIGLSYRNAGKIDYVYKMDGVDSVWRTTKSRVLRFPLLPPGSYTFSIKAVNNAGVTSLQAASFSFIIRKPYWQTWWFRILMVLILFAISFTIFYLFNRVKIKEQKRRSLLKKNMKKFQQEAAMSQVKSRFFANISHELRTPLSLIMGPLESLKAKTTDKNLLAEYSGMLKHSSRLLLLINQLLDISKIEKGKLRLELTKVKINMIVDSIVSSYYTVANEKGIVFQFVEKDKDIQIYVDVDKLEKILYNLLSNAFKFTTKGGDIEVLLQISEDSKYIEIAVKDSGIGIPGEKLPFVFDRFYQVDGGRNRSYEGTGIGLALTKELVELHKGSIEVKSVPSVGSEFIVRLPLDKSVYTGSDVTFIESEAITPGISPYLNVLLPTSGSDHEMVIDASSDKRTVLIVEDNEDMISYISQNLRDAYQVEEARNGEEGVNRALEIQPDLILSDVMMPKVDGLQMTKMLKENPLTCHIPIILLTAKASPESKLEGFELLADDYIVKPFSIKEVIARINAQLINRQILRNKFQKMITVEPSEVTSSSLDEKFLQQALRIIEANLSNAEFSVDDLCKELSMSRTNIHLKLKAIVNQSTTEFIRSIRLKRAAQLLKQKEGSATEIAYKVGFTSQPYFSRCFKEYFKVSPTDYQ
jgi:signal transduction histidine kinase/DNA-binding response OmpR family regulator/ligand-binding sensor domain-containing protein